MKMMNCLHVFDMLMKISVAEFSMISSFQNIKIKSECEKKFVQPGTNNAAG